MRSVITEKGINADTEPKTRIKNLFKKDIIAAEFANAKTELKLEDDSINNQVYEEKDPDSDEMLIYALHLPTFSKTPGAFWLVYL